MSGTRPKHEYDQFDSLDPPGEPHWDESTERSEPLKTWDSYSGEATGTGEHGNKKKKTLHFFKKTSKDKAEEECEILEHKSSILKKQCEEYVKKYDHQQMDHENVVQLFDLSEKQCKILGEKNALLKKELEERNADITNLQEKFALQEAQNEEKLQSAEKELQNKETTISCFEKLLDEQIMCSFIDADSKSEDYKARLFDVQQQFSRQKQIWSQKLQAFDLLKRTMKTQYEGEMMKLEEEYSDKISSLSKEMDAKDQKVALYEQDLELARKHLRESMTDQDKLSAQLQKLEQENAMLKGTDTMSEIEMLKIQVAIYREDYETEREDRVRVQGTISKLKEELASLQKTNELLMQARPVDDNFARYTKVLQQVSTQIGDLSEDEKTSLKVIVENVPQVVSIAEEQQEIRLICKQMEELRFERQIAKKTNLMIVLDPNLTCHKCNKRFREGEIQKFKSHVKNCSI